MAKSIGKKNDRTVSACRPSKAEPAGSSAGCCVLIEGRSRREAVFFEGETYLDLLRREGIPVNAVCGGQGTCGKCRITIEKGSREKTVLACRTPVDPDAAVLVDRQGAAGVLTGSLDDHGVPDVGEEAAVRRCVVAVDLGTTTVAARALDPETGRTVGSAAGWNAQRSYGGDVITRIQYIIDHPGGLEELSRIIRAQILELSRRAAPGGKTPERIFLAGNTVMEHIAAGISPVGIASAPFTPESLFNEESQDGTPASYFEIEGIPVWCSPCVAGYVGGDITAGLYASGICGKKGTYLYVDIGTNGEMALIRDGRITCCAVASGPAFEGAGISCGMPGVSGAVDHVARHGERWDIHVIRGSSDETVGKAAAPKGICGSGLIDLLAELLRSHIVDGYGRLLPPDELEPAQSSLAAAGADGASTSSTNGDMETAIYPFVDEEENGNGVFHLAEDVSFTAKDVRQLQLAKAAVAAGIDVLLNEEGIAAEDVDELILAGGFGTRLDPHSAAEIGMFPAALESKARAVGNASLDGVARAAADPESADSILAIRDRCRYLELSANEEFDERYPEQMIFYEEDEEDE